ncbi:MAG: hypothetical protein AAFZ80_14810 [Cyanobacteria bacterium P01_A01_bin.105]
MSLLPLTRLAVSLGTGLMGLWMTLTPALAAPAPVFEPVLDELVAALPEGWGIRLPTSVTAEMALYPYIDPVMTTYGSVFVGLSTEPDCTAGDCVGALILVRLPMDDWPPSDEEMTTVDLGNGIEGYAALTPEGQQLRWLQDDLLYVLVHQLDVISAANGLAMATSMISEPPITAAD